MKTLAETVYVHDGPSWWPIFPILFWLTIIAVVVFFRRRGPWSRGGAGATGQSVLAERFARGEISEREYQERLNVLKGKS